MSVLVGKKAPDFTVPAVLADGTISADFTLSKEIEGRYGLVFFYPLDFTFVCPSELIALNHRMDALRGRNVAVIGVSIDSHFTHNCPNTCLLYTSPSPRDRQKSRMPSSA